MGNIRLEVAHGIALVTIDRPPVNALTGELLGEIRFPHSLGLLYSAFTYYCGFKVNSAEYKLMGLAPYGQPTMIDKVREFIDVKDDGTFRLNMKYFAYEQGESMFNSSFEEVMGRKPRNQQEFDEWVYLVDRGLMKGCHIDWETVFKIAEEVMKWQRM